MTPAVLVYATELNWERHPVLGRGPVRLDLHLDIGPDEETQFVAFFRTMLRSPTWLELVSVLNGTWTAPAIPDGSGAHETG